MADKRYYWLKLQEDFFKSKRIKKLRKIAGGDTYTIIYLKMQLLSIKNKGILEYTGLEPSFAEEIALDIDEEVDDVAITINYLQNAGLIETADNKEYMLPFAAENIGSEGESAERMRKFREKEHKVSQCDELVQKSDNNVLYISNSDSSSDSFSLSDSVREIINYLNLSIGTNYKPTTNKTISLIKARLNEGFTVDDFKLVIDKKVKTWGADKKMNLYLRPETLFGTKFEGYLNEKEMMTRREEVDSWV